MNIRESVRNAYSDAATNPSRKHAFPVGEKFARSLGYPRKLMAKIPVEAKAAFAGVSNIAIFAEIPPGSVVLDLGCGAGMDSLISRQRTGPDGQVIGVDFSETMLERARKSVEKMGFQNIDFKNADAENLPVANAVVDVALVNGIFNLNPSRQEIFAELARVIKPGGCVYAAELILKKALPEVELSDPKNWLA